MFPKEIPLFKVFMPPEAGPAVLSTLQSGYLAEGERVREFRDAARLFLRTQYVVPVSSCTMALTIAYELAGVSEGDEVISTPLTCIATNIPIRQKGAHIVWADVDPQTGMIDPSHLESLITKKTKAIVVLHKEGDLARMEEILAIAKSHGLKVIEDAAHAFGAEYRGRKVGSLGDYACFSLQAIKHVTTGDGGILTTSSERDWLLAKRYKWFGLDKEILPPGMNPYDDDITVLGYKGNMNDLAATIGIAAMPHAGEILSAYRRNGAQYTELLKDVKGIELVRRDPSDNPTYWTYVILSDKRDAICSALKDNGVASGVVHPRNDTYSIFKASKRELPGLDMFSRRELSLPCGWWVEEEDIARIVGIIRATV